MSDFTVMKAGEAPDWSGDAPGAFIGYAKPMGSEQLGLNVRVLEPGESNVPPGGEASWGHRHPDIEEIYFVLEGELTVKLDDDKVVLGERDAVRIPPETFRAARNCSDANVTFLMLSPQLDDPMAQTESQADFWPENT